jgi:hypothetical protein
MLIELTACWFAANVTWKKFGPRADYIERGVDGVTSIVFCPDVQTVFVYREKSELVDAIPWAGVAHAKCSDPIELFTRPKGKK